MIFILNSYPKLNQGHFWVVDGYIRKALIELKIPFTYINLSADLAAKEDIFPKNHIFNYHKVNSYESYFTDSINLIDIEIRNKMTEKNIFLLTWLPQFTDSDMDHISKIAIKYSAKIVGISLPTSEALIGKDFSGYRYQHQKYFNINSQNILWVGEEQIIEFETLTNIRFLPEYGEVSNFNYNKKQWDISFFGQLSSYRGLSEVLFIALFNPKLKIRIKGYSYSSHRCWRPIKLKFFRYSGWKSNPIFALIFSAISIPISLLRFLPNVTFSNKPFDSEKELDEGINLTKVMFYGAKLTHGSGIMTKSISAGIPILWTGWEGHAFKYLSSNFKEGFVKFYEFFIPNRISKKIRDLPVIYPKKDEMWNVFVKEISILG